MLERALVARASLAAIRFAGCYLHGGEHCVSLTSGVTTVDANMLTSLSNSKKLTAKIRRVSFPVSFFSD